MMKIQSQRRFIVLKQESGFTLLEVLIAVTILSVGILMLSGFQITAIKANGIGSKVSEGTVLTEDAIETLKSLAKNDPRLSVNGGLPHTAATDTPTAIPNVTSNGVTYTRSYTVVNNTNTLTVTMTTTWSNTGVSDGGTATTHSATMTLIF